MKYCAAILFAAVSAFATPSYATVISEGVWKLENSSVAGVGGDFGFTRRSDNGQDLYDFSGNGADVRLIYNAEAGTISVEGQAFDIRNQRLVDIDLNYDGVSSDGERVATSFMNAVGTFDGVEVMSKGSSGESLFLNSLLQQDTVKGSAWLGTDAGHFGDFHFAGTRIGDLPNGSGGASANGSVPAPGGLAFLVVGAAALYTRKRLKAKAATPA